MGHIELAAPVVHIWYLRGTRSWLAYLLMGTLPKEELKAKQLEKVIYFADEETLHQYAAENRDLRLFDEELSDEQSKAINRCIQKVTEETEGMRFNTAIAAMMEFTNAATKWEKKPRKALEPFVLLLGPYAPHLSEELWAALGHEGSNAYVSWPEADASLLVEESATLAVQINGKMRGKIEINKDASQDEAMALAMAQESIAKFVEDESLIKKIVYVPGKILNVVAPPAKK
jgi:leucyl-tRNA synthetase